MRFAHGYRARDRGAIGTRLLNLSGADGDHPGPSVQDEQPGGTRGALFDMLGMRYWLMKSIGPGPFGTNAEANALGLSARGVGLFLIRFQGHVFEPPLGELSGEYGHPS